MLPSKVEVFSSVISLSGLIGEVKQKIAKTYHRSLRKQAHNALVQNNIVGRRLGIRQAYADKKFLDPYKL